MNELSTKTKAIVLMVCCASILLVGIDMTAVNVALPAIGRSFDTSVGGLSWTIDAYTLTLASLLMFSASAADRVGRKRVFLIGLTLFAIGSGLCAVAPSLGWLIAFRALQAVGGSMLNPVAMAIITMTFPQPAERARAIGVWAGATGLGLAIGPIAGGALVSSSLGWRWIFAINIPIALIAIAVAARVVTESKAPHPRRPDPIGQLLVMSTLGGLTLAVIEGGRSGWTAPEVVAGFVVFAFALIGLLLYEPRREDPMLHLGFFRSIPFSGANIIAIAAFAVLSSFLFLNSLYLQQGRGFTPLHAGLVMVPVAIVSLVYGPINGHLLAAYGPRPCFVIAGLAYVAAGLLLTTVTLTSALPLLLVAYACIGLGNAAVGAPITTTAVDGMPRAQASLAAGVSSTTRQIGATLGVAIASVTLGGHATTGAGLATATHTGWWLIVAYGAITLIFGLLITTAWAQRTTSNAIEQPAAATTGHPGNGGGGLAGFGQRP